MGWEESFNKMPEKGQIGTAAFLVLVGSIALVAAFNLTNESAANESLNPYLVFNNTYVISTTDNTSNSTASNVLINFSGIIENFTFQNLNDTTPINLTTNQSKPAANAKLNKINITEALKMNKGKVNKITEDFLSKAFLNDTGKFLIKFKSGVDAGKLENVSISKSVNLFDAAIVDGKAKDIASLLSDSEIEYIEIDQKVTIIGDGIPYNINKVKAPLAWNLSNGTGVKVAVLDTGIGHHSDLNVAGGVSFLDNNYWDSNGHGTEVAGVIAATLNNDGIVGVSPAVSLYSVKIMQYSTGDLSNAIAGVEWSIENNMSIISMSFGIESYSQIFKDVLQEAYDDGIILVAASGNEGTDTILYPAAYSSVIAVGATTANDELAYFSSYGFEQELVAPGVDINTTTLRDGYGTASGTSLAAPHVTGVAALIKSFNDTLTNTEIRNKLRNDAMDLGDAGKDDYFGYGLVQVNLQSNNFSYINDSYYYEIFDITDYGFENESYWFWLEGNGSVDDVDFEEGYYLINITFQNGKNYLKHYNVTKNGKTFLMEQIIFLHDDDYSQYGSSNDGILWKDGIYRVKLDSEVLGADADCYDTDSDWTDMEYCLAGTSGDMDACDNLQSEINCNTFTDCEYPVIIGIYHPILNTGTISTYNVREEVSAYCGTLNETNRGDVTRTVYIIDKIRANCLNLTHYNVEGHYGSNNWVNVETLECTGTADLCSNDMVNYTTPSSTVDPCVIMNSCSGNVQVITQDSKGELLNNLLVTRESVSNQTTSDGFINYNMTRTCGQDIDFDVYCSDNTTYCGSKSASMDFNGDFDSLVFDCSVCSGAPDLAIDLGSINANQKSGNVYTIKVNITIDGSFALSDVNVTVKGQNKDTGLIERENSTLISIASSDRSKLASINFDISNINYLNIYVDTKNKAKDPRDNNYVLYPFIKRKIAAYLDINTGVTAANTAIRNYLKAFVDEKSTQGQATVTISVGKKSQFANVNTYQNFYTLENYGWGIGTANSVLYNKKSLSFRPYTGLVGGFSDGSNFYIFAYGKDIEGDIATLKKLISQSNIFFSEGIVNQERLEIIDDFDTIGIKVMDIMHNPENHQYYRQNNAKFADVITKILNDNNFEISIKTVMSNTSNTQNSTLRLKNLNSDLSDDYRDTIINTSKPVVLSGGIFSNLFTFENGLGGELANEGYDVWTIELTGGPQIECDNCYDYTYDDLVNGFWPTLVSGVLEYSGKNKIDYIGHSNGCRVALSSLNEYSNGKGDVGFAFDTQTGKFDTLMDLPANPVDKFFGIGCPVTLSANSQTKENIENLKNGIPRGRLAIASLNSSSAKHITKRDFVKALSFVGKIPVINYLFDDNNKIALNLMNFYVEQYLANNYTSPFNLSLNEAHLYMGDEVPITHINTDNDGAVPIQDIYILNQSISSPFKTANIYHETHSGILENNKMKEDIEKKLK